jgi:hypothetical protein
MTDIDTLRELRYSDCDPQFADPDAYDIDEHLDKISKAKDYIDEALGCLDSAIDIHETKGLEKAKKLLTEAFNRLEEES